MRLSAEQVGADFLHQNRGGRRIVHQVMRAQPGHPTRGRFGIVQRHQRCLAQVQRAVTLTPRFNAQARRTPHHLHRLLQGIPRQAGAQDVVAVDYLLQGLGKGIQLVAPLKAELRLLLVRVVLVGEVVVEQAFL